jgi:cytochrome b561
MPPIRNTARTWGWPARLLHWFMGGVIVFMLGLGFYTAEFVTDVYEKFSLVQLHKSWGFVVFALALVRLVWRLSGRTPQLPAGVGRLPRLAARGGHLALYTLMVAMPLTGWLMASASTLQDLYGIKNMVFALFEMPDPFIPGDAALEAIFADLHFWCAIALLTVLGVHGGAAIKHHFIDRDDVLRRMTLGK